MTNNLQLTGHGPVVWVREVKFGERPEWLPPARYALVMEPEGSIHWPQTWLVRCDELQIQVSAA